MPRFSRHVLVLVLLFFSLGYSQQKFTLSGNISEENSNETLIGVTVGFPEQRTGVTTNEYGFYSITLPEGKYTLVVSYLGFKSISKEIELIKNVKLDFKLQEQAEQLEEVVVSTDVERLNIRKPQMSVNSLSVANNKKNTSYSWRSRCH